MTRAAWACPLVVMLLPVPAQSADRAQATPLQIEMDDEESLLHDLATLAQERLPNGFHLDVNNARVSLSAPLPRVNRLFVKPLWGTDSAIPPQLPLAFDLWPEPESKLATASRIPIRATLAAPLLRDVWVAARRLRKGSVVSCADLRLQRRTASALPRSLFSANPCEIAGAAVALRDIAADDVIRLADVGTAPDVAGGAAVNISVAINGIKITTAATALADARVGDQVDVRLQRPPRTLRAQVTGPGSVRLLEHAP